MLPHNMEIVTIDCVTSVYIIYTWRLIYEIEYRKHASKS